MKRMMLVAALGALVFPACGEEPTNETALFDPSVAIDEDAACADPQWYCNYIGAISMTGATNQCIALQTLMAGGTQTNTCELSGTQWNVYDSRGNSPENSGSTFPCSITHVNTYNHKAGLAGQPMCRIWFDNWYIVNPSTRREQRFENHYVHSAACSTGFVQCKMWDRYVPNL